MESTWQWQLSLVQWQIFGSLSFRANIQSVTLRRQLAEKLLTKIANINGMPLWNLAYVLRFEDGELTGRPHVHYVISLLPKNGATVQACMVHRQWWREIAGLSVINPIDHYAPGDVLGYLTKGVTSGAVCYEIAKFGKADAVFCSPMARMEMLRARAFGRKIT